MEVTRIPMVKSLKGEWSLKVNGTTIPDVYPFLSVTDLKRLIWMHYGGESRWSPERVFLGVRGPASSAGLRPVEFTWPTEIAQVDLPDPRTTKEPNPALVDSAGVRKPIYATMIGALTLEAALSPEILATGTIPALEAISLDDLVSGEAVDDRLLGGYYQLYFPWLKTLEPKSTEEAYAATVPYTEDRTARIGIVEACLAAGLGGSYMTLDTFVRLKWILPMPMSRPESLEKTFYSIQASVSIPFLRYYPAKGTGAPLLKLGLNQDGSPVLSDPKIFSQYLSQPAPNSTSAVVVARCPLTSEYAPAGTAFTIHMFEDGTSDVVLEVPQRGMTFISAIAIDAQRVLKTVMTSIGFPPEAIPSIRDIHATYKWTHPNPKRARPLSGAKLQARVLALTPFLEAVPQVDGEKALATFQWRATSNYESESAQFQYITQLVLRGSGSGTPGQTALTGYIKSVQARFGLTEPVARAAIESWLEKRADAVAPASGSSVAVARHSFGASIAVYSSHPEYRVEVQGVESDLELQRLLSVVGVLLGSSDSELTLTPPVPAIQAVATVVALEDAKVAEAVPTVEAEGFEGDDYGDLLADLGFGGGDEVEEVPQEAPEPVEEAGEEAEAVIVETGPLPNLTAAIAAVEDECGANPIPASTVLDIADDWYMARLKRGDPTMFGYPASKTGRIKTYSKSCQRRDDRQPNIMTLTEYARVKNCYQEKVRFVDLPPQKPSDLPQDPAYNPKRKYADDYYLIDPVSKKPMWTVYGYENKSRAGEYLYLICSEFWCDYDNLPLMASEYMGTQGRGFTKKAQSCPFCGGGPIRNMDKPAAGESVVVREPKDSTGKVHSFIGTMTRTKHPAGYGLPCCDTTPRLLKHFMTLAASGKLGLKEVPVGEGEAEAEVAEVPPEEEYEPIEERAIPYRDILRSMQTEYILGNDKALEAGKIALVPPVLEAFFGQHSKLKSQGIKKIFDETYCFVRVGVETQTYRARRGMNLFAGLAPLLGMDNAGQVLRLFLGQRNPLRLQETDEVLARRLVRSFEAANYGSLLIEFAAKSNEVPAQGILEDFAQRNGYTLGPARAHVTRLYRAWTAFLKYLVDPARPKQLRHLEHMLAQPGPISPRGIQLIVLEQDKGSVRIVCPSFGIPTAPLFSDVPISFLWHEARDDSWEPLVLYNGTKDAVKFFGERSPELAKLPKAFQAAIMGLIRSWKSLQGCARPAPPPHVWTPDRDTSALPRLSGLLTKSPTAIVRDRSNRLAGVVLSGCFVPCLDDGNLVEGFQRLYEAEMIPAASWASYEKVYGTLAGEYKGLKPVALLSKDAQIIGFRTEVGSMVPVMPEPLGAYTLPVDQLDMFPWERDTLVLRPPDQTTVIPLEETASLQDQTEEAYQHLRLSFSRWLIRDARGPNLRKSIAAILKATLPLFEKRKRMDILLGPKIQEFIEESASDPVTLPLLRQDCLTLPESQCSGVCKWSTGRCLIHVGLREGQETGQETGSQTVMVMTARLSDELIRYSRQSREILDDSVPTIRTPRGSVRAGNELYLTTKPKELPEDIMGRLGLTLQGQGPQIAFPEELLRFEGAEDEVMDLVDETMLGPDWSYKGFTLPTVLEGLEDPRGLVFAGVTNKSLEDWTALLIQKGLALDWSPAMYQAIADIMQSNLLFVRAPARIETWYQPVQKIKGLTLYSIFWGPQQLLLSKGKNYRFSIGELPGSLLTSLDSVSPFVQSSGSVQPQVGQPIALIQVEPVVPEAEAPKVVEVTPELPKVEAVEAEPPKPVEAEPPKAEAAPEPPKVEAEPPKVEAEPPKAVEVAPKAEAEPPKPVEPVEIAEPIKVTAEEPKAEEPPIQPSAEQEDEKGFLDTVSEFLGMTGESKEPPKEESPKEESPKAEEPKEVPKEAPKESPKESPEAAEVTEQSLNLGLDDLGDEAPTLEG